MKVGDPLLLLLLPTTHPNIHTYSQTSQPSQTHSRNDGDVANVRARYRLRLVLGRRLERGGHARAATDPHGAAALLLGPGLRAGSLVDGWMDGWMDAWWWWRTDQCGSRRQIDGRRPSSSHTAPAPRDPIWSDPAHGDDAPGWDWDIQPTGPPEPSMRASHPAKLTWARAALPAVLRVAVGAMLGRKNPIAAVANRAASKSCRLRMMDRSGATDTIADDRTGALPLLWVAWVG